MAGSSKASTSSVELGLLLTVIMPFTDRITCNHRAPLRQLIETFQRARDAPSDLVRNNLIGPSPPQIISTSPMKVRGPKLSGLRRMVNDGLVSQLSDGALFRSIARIRAIDPSTQSAPITPRPGEKRLAVADHVEAHRAGEDRVPVLRLPSKLVAVVPCPAIFERNAPDGSMIV